MITIIKTDEDIKNLQQFKVVLKEFGLECEVNPEDLTTITKNMFRILTDRSGKLEALENGGVDNWAGYQDSLDEWENNA